eukprot:PITA_16027
MVLVQDDDEGNEHVIYYLSHNLIDTETCYAHVEKLALANVQVVQHFRNYILLRTTTVISECNHMTYILTHQLLGVLPRCLTLEEAEIVLSDCHSGACGGHMPGYATAQKILHISYFQPSIFKDCILVVRKCHECQIYQRKMRAPPAHLHPVITVDPFSKWGIEYMTCNPHSAEGHGYIIVIVDYFTKWAEAMPTYSADGKTMAQFLFNHVIFRFAYLKPLSQTMATISKIT